MNVSELKKIMHLHNHKHYWPPIIFVLKGYWSHVDGWSKDRREGHMSGPPLPPGDTTCIEYFYI